MEAGTLVRYDAMVHAIAECHRVDEIKTIHDKALALELYAKVALDQDSERKACDVRLRAERRAGEMLALMKRGAGPGRGNKTSATVADVLTKASARPPATVAAGSGRVAPATVAGASEYNAAIKTAGIKERTATRWQELAAVPKKAFEAALSDPAQKPSATSILKTMKTVTGGTSMDDNSLWIWGRIRDFERWNVKRNPLTLLNGMTDTMQADIRRALPAMLEWLGELKRSL